jgi:hypothetical protein
MIRGRCPSFKGYEREFTMRKQVVGLRARAGQLLTRLRADNGMNTAEYAVGTLAAVAFAGLLLKVVTSDTVQQALTAMFQRALG